MVQGCVPINSHVIFFLLFVTNPDKSAQPQRLKGQHPIFAKLLEVIKDSPDAHTKWYPAGIKLHTHMHERTQSKTTAATREKKINDKLLTQKGVIIDLLFYSSPIHAHVHTYYTND